MKIRGYFRVFSKNSQLQKPENQKQWTKPNNPKTPQAKNTQ